MTLQMRRERISRLANNLLRIRSLLRKSFIEIQKLESDELRRTMMKPVLPVIERYEFVLKYLKADLEQYFEQENKESKVSDFAMRRLYKLVTLPKAGELTQPENKNV